MKDIFHFFLFFISAITFGQSVTDQAGAFIWEPEIFIGKTMKANEDFPKRGIQKQLIFKFGWDHSKNLQRWVHQLNNPKTGFSVGVTEFGNTKLLGFGFTAMPFIEFRAFNSNRWSVLSGMGASYITEKFHSEKNPMNKAVTTDLTWAFRLYLYYKFLSTEKIEWRTGIGYSHHSNGHMRLMNQGYNSFLLGVSASINNNFNHLEKTKQAVLPEHDQIVHDYIAVRGGLGKNVFALAFNDVKNVYTIAGEYGKIYNNTFKVGIGFYTRLYQHYYDYIIKNESLVQEHREFERYKNNPLLYSSNLGLSIHGEVLLNHFGIDIQLGYNLFKPGYKIEYRINEGWENTPREIPENWTLGELNSYFAMKYRISTRLGLKYYFIGMEKSPRNNFYLGAHINANLGQADFSELGFGYVHSFNQ